MADPLATQLVSHIGDVLAAVAGLGTAAYGLVDVTKASSSGGLSKAGFSYVEKSVARFIGDGAAAAGSPEAFGRADMIATLFANWLNGVKKVDQKATAKALIRLGLTPANAPRLARAAGIDATHLTEAATKISAGAALGQQDLNILGRFDAIASAAIDLGYERADQAYRNTAKLCAGAIAVALAVVGGGLLFHHRHVDLPALRYFRSSDFLTSILVGVLATPLAPVAKDLTSSLSAAVSAVASMGKR